MSRTQSAAHTVLKRVAQVKGTNPATLGKEVVIAWLTAVCTASESRLAGGEKGVLDGASAQHNTDDDLMLGVCAVALRFMGPPLDKFDATPDAITPLVTVTKLTAWRHRVGSLPLEPVLGVRYV